MQTSIWLVLALMSSVAIACGPERTQCGDPVTDTFACEGREDPVLVASVVEDATVGAPSDGTQNRLVLHDGTAYWTNGSTLLSTEVASGRTERLREVAAGATISSIAADELAVYWSEQTGRDSEVWRRPHASGESETWIHAPHLLLNITARDGTLWWMHADWDSAEASVFRVNIEDGETERFARVARRRGPFALTETGALWPVADGPLDGVAVFELSNGQRTGRVLYPFEDPTRIVSIHADTDTAYWVEERNTNVRMMMRRRLDGSDTTSLVFAGRMLELVAWSDDGFVAGGSSDEGSWPGIFVWRDGVMQQIAQVGAFMTGIAVEGDQVFWVDENPFAEAGTTTRLLSVSLGESLR